MHWLAQRFHPNGVQCPHCESGARASPNTMGCGRRGAVELATTTTRC
ncbi:MAG: hypothetical protein H0W76_16165 [Pyrinomonadaceae bacterium]|nr:hypothetical protein [Pyrinomonadaceae bacterium]